jgi:transcriptional regulator with XRE-family HTH domain
MSGSFSNPAVLPMTPLPPDERAFCKAMGERIARARKAAGMTQVQLAEVLELPQQTIANWEVGSRRVPVVMVPKLLKVLALTFEELVGVAAPAGRRGPAPKLLQQIERIQRLPKSKQRFVMQMIDTALHASNQAEAAE